MTEETTRKLEDVECPILNREAIQVNQGVIKRMGGNPAEVRSPGLKAQMVFDENYHLIENFCPKHRQYCLGLKVSKSCLFEN